MSDSDSSKDSDCGIRFKTQSVRNVTIDNVRNAKDNRNYPYFNNDQDTRYSHKRKKDRRRSRSLDLVDERTHKRKKKSKKSKRDDHNKASSSKSKKCSSTTKSEKVSDNEKFSIPETKQESERNSSSDTLSKKEDIKIYGPVLPILDQQKIVENNVETSTFGLNLFSKKQIEGNVNTTKSTINSLHRSLSPKKADDENKIKENDISVFGPSLPPKIQNKISETDCEINDSFVFGPSLPPKIQTDQIIGPSLPSTTHNVNESQKQPSPLAKVVESDDTSCDDELIGPLPVQTGSSAETLLEIRALELKMRQNTTTQDEKQTREEWMLSLPDVKLFSSVPGPRQFRTNAGPDFSDRSMWTDTPEDKAKKKRGEQPTKCLKDDLKAEAEHLEIQKLEKEQEQVIKKHHKKNSERNHSLLDLHQKKLMEKKKETGEVQERRPFDRDIDLKINRIDPTKKTAMIKNASLLNSKFAFGKTKFL